MNIEWNGFLEHAIDEYPKEACAFLYSCKPYDSDERWIVWKVKNVSENPKKGWIPDKKDVAKLKRWADKMGYVKIGNIHTHPFSRDGTDEDFKPSDTDLKFARKFNDIVRGILVTNGRAIAGIRFHDKFGNVLDTIVIGE